MRLTLIPAGLLIFGMAIALGLAQQQDQGQTDKDHVVVAADDVEYQPGPPSLPEGSEFAVLEGDPSQEGFFTMRLKLPPNYRIPPHTHPKVERVTVLSGTGRLGMGRTWSDGEMQTLPEGSFFSLQPGMAHFAGSADEEVVLQLNSQGPWEINYINPADDPRREEE